MKKVLFALCLLVIVFNLNAQDDSTTPIPENFNEIKLNGLYLVLGALDVTYERTLNEESGVGASIFVPFDRDDINTDINFYFSPYYRFYFGKKYAAGFFVEGFGLLTSYDNTDFFIADDVIISDDSDLAFALGIGVGGKWITNSGFLGELSLGIGRNIINAEDFVDDLVGKVSIGIGYRF